MILSNMNIHNYTSASSATSGSTSFNSLEDPRNGMIPPAFSLFYNNPYLKDMQAFYAKESPIPPPDPITPPVILTPSLVLPPSLLFDHRYFFVPEELLPPKKQIHPPSSSLTTIDFASWQQRIRLYCRGKENGVNILKSIDEGPYQLRTVWETLAEITLNSKFVNNMLPEWGRFVTAVKLNRGLRDSNYDQMQIARNCTQPKRPQNSEYYKDKMLLMQAQENGVALDVEQMLFLEAFDSDVDEAPTAQTMFIANLSSADPITDEARPSYDSNILSKNKVAIGYKNPLCLIRAKQVQPALYNGHEIIKDNHAPAIVHNTKDTLEIAEITRKKMNAKMNNPELFFVATNSELIVARFIEMNVAHTIVEARCLALEAELANLPDKSHHDNQEELINRFSKLEVNHLDLLLKYQNLKDGVGNNLPPSNKDTLDFDSVFVIGKMQASLQGKDNVIRQLKKQISQLQVTRKDADHTLKDNSPRIHRNAGYEGQRSGTVAGTRDTVGSSMVQKSGIQCYNCKEYGHIAR
nr:retrovirus-related Pol polyprotein from transposon TNT 1-94 [Tanacetum cinerariifolium]